MLHVTPAALIRDARNRSGLTQAELARRVGTTQTAIARLERPGSNPRLATLQRTLLATGHGLEIGLRKSAAGLDEAQIARHLALTPAERARAHDVAYRETRELVRGARRVDG